MSIGGRHSLESSFSAPRSGGPLRIAIIVAVTFALQALVGSNIAIAGVAPNFFLLALVAIAASSSMRATIISGFVLGLLFDLLGTGPVGAMALLLSLAGFALGNVLQQFKVESLVSWLIMAAATALVVSIVYCIIMAITGYEQAFFAALIFKALPWTLYSIVMAIVVWPAVRRVLGLQRSGSLESRISR